MDLQQIRYFLALARELHYWKTAEKMNITQSALTRRIQSLENELGLLLFDRNKRNVKLTDIFPSKLNDAKLYVITSNHGANSGGEEYNRRNHYIYFEFALFFCRKND